MYHTFGMSLTLDPAVPGQKSPSKLTQGRARDPAEWNHRTLPCPSHIPTGASPPYCHTNPIAPTATLPLKDVQRKALWPSHAVRKLCTTIPRGPTKLRIHWTSIGNSSSWLFTPFKYLQTYRAPSSAAGKPSYTYLSHLIFPHKSISPVNLSTP